MRTFATLLAVLVFGIPSARAQDSWSLRTFTNAAEFSNGGGASDGRFVYAVVRSYALSHSRRWDPTTTAWEDLALPPEVVWGNALVHCERFIYSIGNAAVGVDPDATGNVLRYDPAADAWSTLGIRPSAGRCNAQAAALGSRIYVIGGSNSSGAITYPDCEELDVSVATPVFLRKSSLPVPVRQHAAVADPDRGTLLVAGGLYDSPPSSGASCWEFDPGAGTSGAWTTLPPFPLPISPIGIAGLRGFFLHHRIYLAGGYNNGSPGGPRAETFEYYPFRRTWTRRDDMSLARYLHAAAAVGDHGYVVGGASTRQDAERYEPPAFGADPEAPTDLRQVAAVGAVDVGGVCGRRIAFQATLSDPDPGDALQWEVQIKPSGAAWSTAVTIVSPFGPAGPRTLEWEAPVAGGHDWRHRVLDQADNVWPRWNGNWAEFDSSSPDFVSDQTAPEIPIALSPVSDEIVIADRNGGRVDFRWTASPDIGGASSVSYTIEVARNDPWFSDPALRMEGIMETGASGWLPNTRQPYYWRVRATDSVGNEGEWSVPARFDFVFEDGIDHGAGDANRVCGFGAAPSDPRSALPALLLLTLLPWTRRTR